jgi:hypothetical protein
MEQLFDIESGIKQEFSYAGGRRNECKARGLKVGTKAFRDCTKGLRAEDKVAGKVGKKERRKTRKANLNEAIAEGKVKKNVLGKAFSLAKKANPLFLAMRGSALSLIRLNLWGMATKMAKLRDLSPTNKQAKSAWVKILAHWIKFGGNKESLVSGIDAGKGKKQLLTRKKKQVENTYKKKSKKSKFDGQYGEFFDGEFKKEFSSLNAIDEEFSNIEPVTTSALITAAGTVLTTIISILGKNKNLVGEMPLSETDKDMLSENPPQSDADLSAQDILDAEEENKKKNKKGIAIIVVGAIIIIGAILYLTKKKK